MTPSTKNKTPLSSFDWIGCQDVMLSCTISARTLQTLRTNGTMPFLESEANYIIEFRTSKLFSTTTIRERRTMETVKKPLQSPKPAEEIKIAEQNNNFVSLHKNDLKINTDYSKQILACFAHFLPTSGSSKRKTTNTEMLFSTFWFENVFAFSLPTTMCGKSFSRIKCRKPFLKVFLFRASNSKPMPQKVIYFDLNNR